LIVSREGKNVTVERLGEIIYLGIWKKKRGFAIIMLS
jgi:hypothetical protein